MRSDVLWELMALYLVGFTAVSLETGRKMHLPPMPSVNRAAQTYGYGTDGARPALPFVVTPRPGATVVAIVAGVAGGTVTR